MASIKTATPEEMEKFKAQDAARAEYKKNTPLAKRILHKTAATAAVLGTGAAGIFGFGALLRVIDPPTEMGNQQDCISQTVNPTTGQQLPPSAYQAANARQNNDGLIPECPANFETIKTSKYNSDQTFDASNSSPPANYYNVNAQKGNEWITAQQAKEQGLELSYTISKNASTNPSSISILNDQPSNFAAAAKQVNQQVQRHEGVKVNTQASAYAKTTTPIAQNAQQQKGGNSRA